MSKYLPYGKNSTRCCSICKKHIRWYDFSCSSYYEKYKDLWNNKDIAIPCCACFRLLNMILDCTVLFKKHTHISGYGTYVQVMLSNNKKYSFPHTKYKTLIQWGIIKEATDI